MVESARSLRALVSGMACLFCMVILVSVAIESGGRTKATPPLAAAPVGSLVSLESSPTDRPIDQMNSDPFFGSKRRVPNGPDPIHNRRAGKSGRPPGRA
ncbi:CLAVATA3/ESR (CLE)-related protein 25-like [Cocos nucifera]|uniref:CLAVATA3/ESR (CLE)-related protein 25-like n=1 Tax=Cocos nucifera TaxID=13894 RepID=A0A8K0IWA4_COCNU|nr:CLAVATA3/ESR (CLE)-related protein 25-like [Cocos nucifera]